MAATYAIAEQPSASQAPWWAYAGFDVVPAGSIDRFWRLAIHAGLAPSPKVVYRQEMVAGAALLEASPASEIKALINRWHAETDYMSSPSQIASNPIYLQIIARGESALPHILTDLRDRGGEWYRAIRAIALSIGDVPPNLSQEDLEDSEQVDQVWLDWGKARGYID